MPEWLYLPNDFRITVNGAKCGFLRPGNLRQNYLVVKYREGTGLMDPLALSSV